jgi:1,2-dihydroxy-3-keto-5-methylthiopentene dioxygenase
MTILNVFAEQDARAILRTDDTARIAELLSPYGIQLEHWASYRPLGPDANSDAIIDAYRAEVDKVCAEGGYRLVDVARMNPDDSDPGWPAKADEARRRFLNEHVHAEDEVRYFVEGRGCFYLHLGDRVYAVVCEAGDLMSVPANTTHWFDMGSRPEFCAIRFFEEPDGWIADFTGSAISSTMPTFDELVATSS